MQRWKCCLLLAAVAFIQSSDSLACTGNICQLVDCMPITADSCAGKFVPNGGFCGCCDACLTILNPGDVCWSILTAGAPSTVTCPDHYHCDSTTHKCVAN
ncbi:hypothetical protein Btru_028492 [Bulinus truncatus]|nr:hypothetical protein Btru_028492 [Bulinus truncatus]